MGDSLALPLVFLQAVTVVKEGAVDLLGSKPDDDFLDIGGQYAAQPRLQIFSKPPRIDGVCLHQQHSAGWRLVLDHPTVGELELDRQSLAKRMDSAGCRGTGNQQAVVDLGIDQLFDLFLDMAEIKHHALLIERSGKFDIDNPGFTDQTSSLVEIGNVDHGQVVYK